MNIIKTLLTEGGLHQSSAAVETRIARIVFKRYEEFAYVAIALRSGGGLHDPNDKNWNSNKSLVQSI